MLIEFDIDRRIVSAERMNLCVATVIFSLGTALAYAASIKSFPNHEALSQEMVDYINFEAKTTWKVECLHYVSV